MNNSQKEDELFKLLVNISASSESSLERLSTVLKVFVKKYFENKDFTTPSNPYEVAMNCIMRVEAVLYTVYELENEAHTQDEKLELLYYKDLVLKSLVVLTNLSFFVQVLKKFNLFRDAHELLEKVKTEFKIESTGINYDFEAEEKRTHESVNQRSFKEVKPVQYRKARQELAEEKRREKDIPDQEQKNTGVQPDTERVQGSFAEKFFPKTNKKQADLKSDIPGNELNYLFIPGLDDVTADSSTESSASLTEEFRPFEALKKKIKERSKITEARPGKDGKKVLRTAGGWEISNDVLENLYKDL